MSNKCFLGGHPSFKANPYLVGRISTPLKNMSSSVGVFIPNILKNKTCSKPPTRYGVYVSILCTYRFALGEYIKHGCPLGSMQQCRKLSIWMIHPKLKTMFMHEFVYQLSKNYHRFAINIHKPCHVLHPLPKYTYLCVCMRAISRKGIADTPQFQGYFGRKWIHNWYFQYIANMCTLENTTYFQGLLV